MTDTKETWNRRYEQDYWKNIIGKERFVPIQRVMPTQKIDGICLEIGCALGELTRVIAPLFNMVIGIDISDVAIKECKRRHSEIENIEFISSGFLDLQTSYKFDYILAMNVLYYMLNDKLKTKLLEISKQGTILVVEEVAHTDPPPTANYLPKEFVETRHILFTASDVWQYKRI